MADLTVEINAITLATHDIEASASFYESLGFKQIYRDPTFRSYQLGRRSALNLQSANATTPIVTPWGRPVIYVTSVDTMYERAVAAGYQPESTPQDADWNERYFQIRDPAGHELSFARPLFELTPATRNQRGGDHPATDPMFWA